MPKTDAIKWIQGRIAKTSYTSRTREQTKADFDEFEDCLMQWKCDREALEAKGRLNELPPRPYPKTSRVSEGGTTLSGQIQRDIMLFIAEKSNLLINYNAAISAIK